MNEYLISPVIDASNASELWLEFDQYFNNWLGDEFADVDVYDGNDWVTVLAMNGADVGSWTSPDHQMIDVSEYANADFRVRFHYYNATFDYYWAVDNVMVHDNSGKYADGKAFQFYKIWHDGVFSNDVDTNFYQYGTNPAVDILVPGETYNACVASLYSTGLSAQTCYEWTYLPCDSFPSWTIFDAYNVEGSDENLVVWTDNVFFTPIEEDFEAGLPEGWMTSTSSAVGWFFTTDGSSAFWAIPPGDGTYACSNDDAANDDGSVDYLITPEMSFVGLSDVQLTFSSYLDGAYGQTGTIEVTMDGGATWEVVESVGTATAWTEVQVDLSAYVGSESIWVAFHSNDNGAWASGWAVDNVSIAPSKAGKANSIVKGTNVYRDGEMVAFVPEPDTFFLDMNLEPGYYDYCIAKVYGEEEDDNEMHWWTSCPDGSCVLDVFVPEECIAPTNLTAESLSGDGYTATLNWDYGADDYIEDFEGAFPPAGWMKLNPDGGTGWEALASNTAPLPGWTGGVATPCPDGGNQMAYATYTTGGPASNDQWLISPQLQAYAGYELSFYMWVQYGDSYLDNVDVLLSTTGTNASDFDITVELLTINTDDGWILYTYDLVGLGLVSSGEEFYVAFREHVTDNFFDGAAILFDNFFYGEAGKMAQPIANNTTSSVGGKDTDYVHVAKPDAPYQELTKGAKALTGTNVYRDGELVAFVEAPATTYADEVGDPGSFCYEVTGVYSVCGESAPSNEACVIIIGVDNLENNISVYPNPANDFVMVEASQDIRSIEITNYMGQVVNSVKAVEMTQYRINTSSLSAGIYFVEVETTAGIEKVRIVISK